MPKRTAFGVVLKQQAASAFAEYQDGDAPPAQNGPQLAVPVLPPPHAPPPIVYPWAMPGPSQQETSQQEPSALDLETEFEVARSKAQTPRPPPCPRTRGRRRRARMQSWWWTRRPCPRIRPTLRTALSRLKMSFPSRQRAASSQSEGLLRACEDWRRGSGRVFEHIAPAVHRVLYDVWSVPRYAIECYLSRLVHSLHIA